MIVFQMEFQIHLLLKIVLQLQMWLFLKKQISELHLMAILTGVFSLMKQAHL